MVEAHGQMSMFWPLFFNCGSFKSTKGSLKNIFQDLFNKISSQQLTHDRSYMSAMTLIYSVKDYINMKCVNSTWKMCINDSSVAKKKPALASNFTKT